MLMPERLRISEPGMNLERAFDCGTQFATRWNGRV